MSTKYPGGIISKTAPTPSGPYADDTAPGVWTLEQQAYWQKLGQWPTAGNINPNLFIENLFQTWLYTGTGASQTITNGIDLSGEGGMVWTKCRSDTANNALFDTARGTTQYLSSNLTNAQATEANGVTAFGSTGYTFGNNYDLNENTFTYASWTFRKQAKFFDVVTYTGNGTAGRTVAHNLGSVPGCMIVKNLTTSGTGWTVYHRSLGNTKIIEMNSTAAAQVQNEWNNTDPTSTVFSVASGYGTNFNGDQYVAYLFAHDAGGFGLTGTDNVISCGSFTTDGSGNATVNLGYEPQWVMIKRTDSTSPWFMFDTMRGFQAFGPTAPLQFLEANSSAAEAGSSGTGVTATGFQVSASYTSASIIYIAIRRGPMAVPTSGTSVFVPRAVTEPVYLNTVNLGIVSDLIFNRSNLSGTGSISAQDRLRAMGNYLVTSSTAAEGSTGNGTFGAGQTSVTWPAFNSATTATVDWIFQRAPSFMDVVCYTGNYYVGTDFQALTHNLGVVPELAIIKRRSSIKAWNVYYGNVSQYMELQSTAAESAAGDRFDGRSPTATTFYVGADSDTNTGGQTYVMYLFATCAGVSKVGSYTGTGTTLQIDCGFTGGARFVLIKRTDSTGDWYVWDSARGIVAGNDPYLLLNSTTAEVTGTDYVDTYSAGFEISSTAPSAINASGGTFIFLAIA